MRIVSFLIRSFLLIVAGVIVFSLIAREVLLLWGMSQLQTDAKVVRSLYKDSAVARQCAQQGSAVIEGEQIAIPQLRFTSPTTYTVEVSCSQYQLRPITLKDAKLPPFVTAKPGNSGIVMGEPFTGITIEVYGRSTTVYVEEDVVKTGLVELPFGSGPVSVCTGYGFTCCEADAETGVGQQIATATDCPRSCFSSCQKRPVLLSLSADPFIDTATRVAHVQKGQAVTVHYTAQSGAIAQIVVRVDFGDGTVEQSTEERGSLSHVYACAATSCQYTVRVTIEDNSGGSAARVPYDSFTVQVGE